MVFHKQLKKPVTVLAIAAAVIYNVWPLGYVLNPAVARVGLVSDLEAAGQPYNWLFIGCDVFFGLLVSLGAWSILRRRHGFNLAITGLAAFGIFTAVSALIPLNCRAGIQTCGYAAGQPFGWHDVTGAIAAAGLFLAMAAGLRHDTGRRLKLAAWFLLGLWSITGLWFLYVSVINDHFFESAIVPSQQAFLTLSGLGLVLAVMFEEKRFPGKKSGLAHKSSAI